MDLDRARTYALNRLRHELSPEMQYHNFAHTAEEVVPAAKRFAEGMGFGKAERGSMTILLTAAYFHDIGIVISPVAHEARSVRITRAVLPDFGYTPEQVEQIGEVIMATKLPQSPTNLMGQILADADLDVLGRDDFFIRNRALREEIAALGNPMSDSAWYENQLNFLKKHQYFTQAARDIRDAGKAWNIQQMSRLLEQSRKTG